MNEGIHLDLDTWIVPGQIRKANLLFFNQLLIFICFCFILALVFHLVFYGGRLGFSPRRLLMMMMMMMMYAV